MLSKQQRFNTYLSLRERSLLGRSEPRPIQLRLRNKQMGIIRLGFSVKPQRDWVYILRKNYYSFAIVASH